MKNRLRPMLGGGAIALVLAIPMAYAADNITLTETGSTLLYPLFQSWIAGYKSVASNVDLSAAATGSGAGEKAALAGTASIGTRSLLYGLVISSVLGAIVTWMYRIETTGVNLDRIGREPAAQTPEAEKVAA